MHILYIIAIVLLSSAFIQIVGSFIYFEISKRKFARLYPEMDADTRKFGMPQQFSIISSAHLTKNKKKAYIIAMN